MRRRSSFFLATAVSFCVAALAQSPTPDQINAFKNLPADQQSAILQSMGKGSSGSSQTDTKLSNPQTVRPPPDQTLEMLKENKTRDGRNLRQPDEDPELRADDTVLIDLTPVEEPSVRGSPGEMGNNRVVTSDTTNAVTDIQGNPVGAAIPGAGVATTATTTKSTRSDKQAYDYGRIRTKSKPKTDEELKKADERRQLILKNNPYKLNRFGVLELPGLPAIPLAGLTADEATNRLSADPDLRDYRVKVTLLRLQPFSEEALKPFGYDLFKGVPSTFAPVSDVPVPPDYVVGPGDSMNIQLYGNEPATYMLTVGRDGRINFPKLGPIMVSGMSFDRARGVIEQRVREQLIGARVSVTMGDLRTIRVFVLGEATKPGSYTVGGLATMTNALFVSGGVKDIGSLRKIQLKRNGQLVSTLDLYDLLLRGDNSGDRQLLPGDVIFIPPIGKTVSVYGAVRRPAIYELNQETNVDQVIGIAGGLMPDADGKLVQIERILPSQLRETRNVDVTSAQGRAMEVDNGDKVRVPAIRPTLENSVVLTGYVFRPGTFEYHAGMRLSDVLPSFDELRPNADRRYIMIRREVPPEETVEVVSADLERALAARGSTDDPLLKPRDKIFVFDASASRARVVAPVIRDLELQGTPSKPAQVVDIDGQVKAPGRYPLQPGMRVSDLIRAGGSLDDSAYEGEAELTRYEVVNGSARQTELIPIDLKAVRRGDEAANMPLKPYDLLLIKITPEWKEPGSITVEGEVRYPGTYPIHHGETLSSILHRVGGFTDLAFVDGAVFTREELKKREKEQLDTLANRLQGDLAALSLGAVKAGAVASSASSSAAATQGLVVGQQLLSQLRDTPPVGRLVIDLRQVVKGKPNGPNDVLVRDGDKLLIPKKTQEVTVLGEVQGPTSHIYQRYLSRDDYIEQSGGITEKADRKRIYVVRANGSVISSGRRGWFRKSQDTEIRPGDTVVVPLDTEKLPALPLWTAVTTILYNLAVGLLAVRSV